MKLLYFSIAFVILNLFSSVAQCNDVLFIIDDSGSIDSIERADMQNSIQQLSDEIYSIDSNSRIGIIQYGQQSTALSGTGYYVTLPLTTNPTINLENDPGGNTFIEDVLAYSVSEMIDDGIFSSGGQFENISSIFIFTDACTSSSCSSALLNCSGCTVPSVSCGYDYLSDLSNSLGNIPISVFRVLNTSFCPETASGIEQNGGLLIEQTSFLFSQDQIDQIVESLGCLDAQFEYTNTCLGDTTSFTTTSEDTITSILWDFGDGNTSNLESPTHTYTNSGTYTVNVVAENLTETLNSSFQITIYDVPIANTVSNLALCDSNNNGSEVFNLGQNNSEILSSQDPSVFSVNYYENESDALNHSNELNYNYNNTSNGQIIYAKIFNTNNPDCYAITSFTLNTYQQPTAHPVSDYTICDDISNDNTEIVNLTQFNSYVLNGQSNSVFNISYHLSSNDAIDGTNSVDINYQTISNPQTIYVRIENSSNSNCYDTTSFDIYLDYQYMAYQPFNMYQCDDDSNDGVEVFNLSSQNDQIINGQIGSFNLSYHLTQDDANNNVNSINQPIENSNSNPQPIYARIENATNPDCYDTTLFYIEVLEKPIVDMDDTFFICTNENLTIEAPYGFDEYLWSTGEVSRVITITQSGNYSVTATNNYNTPPNYSSCSTTKNIIVIESDEAVFENIEISDWTQNNNSLTAIVTGIGDYEYSLNGIDYQDDNTFNNLAPGVYDVFVRDKNGCGVVQDDIYLLYYPKFFSPNADGYNDYWQIYYSNTEPDLEIYIFNRFGKLLKKINPLSNGWDGQYNRRNLPSDDYWFLVIRPDNGKQYRGHFSLKR